MRQHPAYTTVTLNRLAWFGKKGAESKRLESCVNPDPGSVSAVGLAAGESTARGERGVEADPESGREAGRRSGALMFVCRERRYQRVSS